jgi:hypothetical protein
MPWRSHDLGEPEVGDGRELREFGEHVEALGVIFVEAVADTEFGGGEAGDREDAFLVAADAPVGRTSRPSPGGYNGTEAAEAGADEVRPGSLALRSWRACGRSTGRPRDADVDDE